MRSSNRQHVLLAALQVTVRAGVRAVTYESVADEAGLTKSGVLYHFPSRRALLHALHEHVVGAREGELERALARPAADSNADERVAAYIDADGAASPAELLLLLEAGTDPDLRGLWSGLSQRWTPETLDDEVADSDLDRLIAVLATDGLVIAETARGRPISSALRARIRERLRSMARPRP